MNLLMSEPPIAICEIKGNLLFDFEINNTPDSIFDIAYDNKTILEILDIFQNEKYIIQERFWIALRIFFLDNIPEDKDQSLGIMNRFIDCDTEWKENKTNIRTYSWKQDGTAIYTGINKTNNNILKIYPDLHWWEFMACFMDMTSECQFNDITSNRLAHKKGKATKEQEEMRRLYPEVYIMHENKNNNDKISKKSKELQELENMFNNN